jgi:hypothetical protein
MSGLDIAAWVFLAIGASAVTWRLVALAAGPSWARRPRPGTHAAPSPFGDPATRRKLWRELQVPLVIIVDGVVILTAGSTGAIRWLLLGIVTLLVPVWDLAAWVRSRATANPAGVTTDPP